jgi:hypothetical protein
MLFEVHRPIGAESGEVHCPEGHDDVARVWSAVSVGGLATSTASAAPASGGGCCGGGCCG